MATQWRKLGPVTREVWDQTLKDAGSLVYPERADAYQALGPMSGLALAQMGVESSFGKVFDANPASNKNAMNLRPRGGAGFMKFDTWTEGLEEYRDRLLDPNYAYADDVTLAELVHDYAPSSDGNNEAAYIADVEKYLRRFNVIQEVTSPSTVGTPTFYYLNKDYARFGLTKAQATEILAKRFTKRYDADAGVTGAIEYIVLHIQAGYTPGSLEWWLDHDASSNVMVQRDGSVLVVIPEEHGPWTNGDDYAPKPAGLGLVSLPGNSNIWSWTCEAEGVTGAEPLKYPAMLNTIEWLVRDVMKRHPKTALPGHLITHSDVNQINKPNCGGAYVLEIQRRVQMPTPPTAYAPKHPVPGTRASKLIGEKFFMQGSGFVTLLEDTAPLEWAIDTARPTGRARKAGSRVGVGYWVLADDGELWLIEGGKDPGSRFRVKDTVEGTTAVRK